MAWGTGIPGLNKALEIGDLQKSCIIYNNLPDDSQQPKIDEAHMHDLAALFVRSGAHKIFGIHLIHAHFRIPDNTVLLGDDCDQPYIRWARPTPIEATDRSNVHGHIFIFTDYGFHPYEYQRGHAPVLGQVDDCFLPELVTYLTSKGLLKLLGLQLIDHRNSAPMMELVLPQGTVMLNESVLTGCAPTRRTGWRFADEDGEPRVCQSNESHGRHESGHEIYNKGSPHPKLETFQDTRQALADKKLLRE